MSVGTCDGEKICNTNGACYTCVKTASLDDTDPGGNALNPHCNEDPSQDLDDGVGGSRLVCTSSREACHDSSSSRCTGHMCMCGANTACSSPTPKCSESNSALATPEVGSMTAICQVGYMFYGFHFYC